MKKIKPRAYKRRVTYDMARILLDHGLASREQTGEFVIRTYLQSKRDEIWVPRIDENAHFELGQRYELYRNFRQNSRAYLTYFLETDVSDWSKKDQKDFLIRKDRYVRTAKRKLRLYERRFIELFLLAKQSWEEKDPILRNQFEAMKNVGKVLTRQQVRINPKTHKRVKRVKKSRKRELGLVD